MPALKFVLADPVQRSNSDSVVQSRVLGPFCRTLAPSFAMAIAILTLGAIIHLDIDVEFQCSSLLDPSKALLERIIFMLLDHVMLITNERGHGLFSRMVQVRWCISFSL